MNNTSFTFKREALTEALQHDVVPRILQNTWNSLVVNRQINSPFLMPWHSIQRTEYMTRLIQEGETEETVYHGKEGNLMPRDRRDGERYVEISTGYGFEPSGHLEFGVSRPGTIALPEAIGVVPPGMFFPTIEGLKGAPALSIYFDYSDRKNIPVSFVLSPHDKGLGLTNPQTEEQGLKTLEIIGKAISATKAGMSVDFEALRTELIEEAGLEPREDMNPALRESFRVDPVPGVDNPSAPVLEG